MIDNNVPAFENDVEVVDGALDDIEVLPHGADIVQAALEHVSNPLPIAPPVHHEYANSNSLPPVQNIDPKIPSFPTIPRPPTPPLPTDDVRDQVLHTPAYNTETMDDNHLPGTSSSQAPTYNSLYDDISD